MLNDATLPAVATVNPRPVAAKYLTLAVAGTAWTLIGFSPTIGAEKRLEVGTCTKPVGLKSDEFHSNAKDTGWEQSGCAYRISMFQRSRDESTFTRPTGDSELMLVHWSMMTVLSIHNCTLSLVDMVGTRKKYAWLCDDEQVGHGIRINPDQ